MTPQNEFNTATNIDDDSTHHNITNILPSSPDSKQIGIRNNHESGHSNNGTPTAILQKLISDNALIGGLLGVPTRSSPPPPMPMICTTTGADDELISSTSQQQQQQQRQQSISPRTTVYYDSQDGFDKLSLQIQQNDNVDHLIRGFVLEINLFLNDYHSKSAMESNKNDENFTPNWNSSSNHHLHQQQQQGRENEDYLNDEKMIHTTSPDEQDPTNDPALTSLSSTNVPYYLQGIASRLSRLKCLLYNDHALSNNNIQNNTPSSNPLALFRNLSSNNIQVGIVAKQVLHSLIHADVECQEGEIIPTLLKYLHLLPFEARKDFASIFNYLLVCGGGSGSGGNIIGDDIRLNNYSGASFQVYAEIMSGFASYIEENFEEIMTPIVNGHYVSSSQDDHSTSVERDEKLQPAATMVTLLNTPDVALHCGSMFRSIMRHPALYMQLLSDEYAPKFIYPFLDCFVHNVNFEVASDSLETLRLILTGGGGAILPPSSLDSNDNYDSSYSETETMMEGITTSTFLERSYTPIFVNRFNPKLLTPTATYITRRISLQLLSTILMTKSNYNVMMKYISNRSNLMTIMILLRDPSPHITLDAFHVFKIFVANPNKSPEIVKILADNKEKLIKYLSGLHSHREVTDEQFRDEKLLVLVTLRDLVNV